MVKWAFVIAVVALVIGMIGFAIVGVFIDIAVFFFWVAVVVAVAVGVLGLTIYKKIT